MVTTLDSTAQRIIAEMRRELHLTQSDKAYLSRGEELRVLLEKGAQPIEINKRQGEQSFAHTVRIEGIIGTHTSTGYLAELSIYERKP